MKQFCHWISKLFKRKKPDKPDKPHKPKKVFVMVYVRRRREPITKGHCK